MSRSPSALPENNLLDTALSHCAKSFWSVFIFSFITNLLSLTPIFYMMNVFGKAVVTSSLPTLYSLAAVTVFAYVLLGLIEWIRSKVLVFVATRLDKLLSPYLFDLSFALESGSAQSIKGNSQVMSDLNNFRQFVSSNNAMVFFDLPWLPVFIGLMLLFHPVLAVVAIICMTLMFIVAVFNQRATSENLMNSNLAAATIRQSLQRSLKNAEVATSMGMVTPMKASWRSQQDDMLVMQEAASSASAAYGAFMKVLGMAVQGVAITVGAVLVMQQALAPAAMIGAALLLGKALAPITQAVGSWRAYVEGYGQYSRLKDALSSYSLTSQKMSLPPIIGEVVVTDLVLVPPGAEKPTITGVSFALEAGTTTMIVGPSAAGKSTLLRALLGIWPAASGEVRIDGTDAFTFDRDKLGPQLGYLPQDIELFDGTVAQNIARFGEIDAAGVVAAAKTAGIHEMILNLPNGYDSWISGSKGLLSPGQRQRVGLARALYGDPRLIILDEPNSNLDEAGELALHSALSTMKTKKATVVVVSHKHTLLPLVDTVIVMSEGKIAMQGPTVAVVERLKSKSKVTSITPTSDGAVSTRSETHGGANTSDA